MVQTHYIHLFPFSLTSEEGNCALSVECSLMLELRTVQGMPFLSSGHAEGDSQKQPHALAATNC